MALSLSSIIYNASPYEILTVNFGFKSRRLMVPTLSFHQLLTQKCHKKLKERVLIKNLIEISPYFWYNNVTIIIDIDNYICFPRGAYSTIPIWFVQMLSFHEQELTDFSNQIEHFLHY